MIMDEVIPNIERS